MSIESKKKQQVKNRCFIESMAIVTEAKSLSVLVKRKLGIQAESSANPMARLHLVQHRLDKMRGTRKAELMLRARGII